MASSSRHIPVRLRSGREFRFLDGWCITCKRIWPRSFWVNRLVAPPTATSKLSSWTSQRCLRTHTTHMNRTTETVPAMMVQPSSGNVPLSTSSRNFGLSNLENFSKFELITQCTSLCSLQCRTAYGAMPGPGETRAQLANRSAESVQASLLIYWAHYGHSVDVLGLL